MGSRVHIRQFGGTLLTLLRPLLCTHSMLKVTTDEAVHRRITLVGRSMNYYYSNGMSFFQNMVSLNGPSIGLQRSP